MNDLKCPNRVLDEAASAVRHADALLVGAGAGMGVDSGLPDFRGNEGFWRAYPSYAHLGLSFAELANPRWFHDDPALAWGFYGHRYKLYRTTTPHDGFGILRKWAAKMKYGAFVVTSNVDGHFQAAGFDPARVWEVHGRLNLSQCTTCGCICETPEVVVDEATMRAVSPLPRCPKCYGRIRPNVLMFNDRYWDPTITHQQEIRFADWEREVEDTQPLVIELGAGTATPTIREVCEDFVWQVGGTHLRINSREARGDWYTTSIALGALEALRAIDRRLEGGK